MKRLIVILLAILTGLWVAPVLTGCGGTKGKAQAAMDKGDEIVILIEKDSRTLVVKTDKTFSDLYKEISAGKKPDAGAFENHQGMERAGMVDAPLEHHVVVEPFAVLSELERDVAVVHHFE